MSTFDIEKGSQYPGGMPQSPAPAATADGGFLPAYEDAVNTNLRTFEHAEGYSGDEKNERTQKADKRAPIWKRCLFIGLPLLPLLVAAICIGLVAFHLEKHSAESSNPSSTTITKRHTVTIIETHTFSASIPPAIAQAASSFYEAWSSSIASEMSVNSEHLIPTSSTSIPLPSINMSPTASPLDLPATTTSSSASSTTIATVNPLGDGFCGLPGTFCAGGKREFVPQVNHAKGDGFCGLPGTPCLGGRDSNAVGVQRREIQKEDNAQSSITTVTKHLTTTTTSTLSTNAPIPSSIIAAAHAYYQQWSISFFGSSSGSSHDITYSSTSTVALPPPPPVTVTTTADLSPTTTTAKESQLCILAGKEMALCH